MYSDTSTYIIYKSKSDKLNTKLNEISIKLVKENNLTKDDKKAVKSIKKKESR